MALAVLIMSALGFEFVFQLKARAAVDHGSELGQRAAAGAPLALLLDVDRDSTVVGWFEEIDQIVDMHSVISDVQRKTPRLYWRASLRAR